MRTWLAALFACVRLLSAAIHATDLSDAQIRELMIRESIARYSGNCPCPYNLDRAGRRCGARSAYIRAGGEQPLCFVSDVTDEMIERYRRTKS